MDRTHKVNILIGDKMFSVQPSLFGRSRDATIVERHTNATVNYVAPTYAAVDRRKDSFDYSDWSSTHSDVNPTEWIDSGFYYTGTSVRCFSCGLGISGIQATDDPWEQHALRVPTCAHLVEQKGQQYIQEIRSRQGLLENQYDSETDDEYVSQPRYEDEYGNWMDDDDFAEGHTPYYRGSPGTNQRVPHNGLESTLNLLSQDVRETVMDENSLLEENKRLKEQMLCKVCRTEKPSYLLRPCGHLACCEGCSKTVTDCPVCHKRVITKIKIFMA